MRNSRNVIDLKSEEVPFGIRAIEAGIEVEGVVISRPQTPTRGSYNHSQTTLVASDSESTKSRGPPPSPRSYAPPPMKQVGRSVSMVYQPSPYLSMPPAAHQGGPRTPSVRSSASSVASTATPSLTRVPSREKMWAGRRSAPEPTTTAFTGANLDGTTRGPSSSIPDTLAKLEGRSPASMGDLKASGSRTLKNSSRTPSPPEGPVAPTLPSVDENEISENSLREGDLSHINEHRLSHAAEVGQLRPRRNRQSRVLSSPVAESPTPGYESPVASDGVYALDIAVPSGMPGIEGLRYPAPAARAGSQARPERPRSVSDPENLPMFDGPWLVSSGDGEKERRGSLMLDEKPRSAMPEPKPPLDDLSNSGRLALLLDSKPEPRPEPKPETDPETDPEPTPEPKPKQKSKPKKLQKRKGRDSSNRGSAAVTDLEAQR